MISGPAGTIARLEQAIENHVAKVEARKDQNESEIPRRYVCFRICRRLERKKTGRNSQCSKKLNELIMRIIQCARVSQVVVDPNTRWR